ncbi:MAG: LacI family DNA-binding transcriptional regulator [Treponemataceae bacterium]
MKDTDTGASNHDMPKLQDVARLAGVSAASVSRVLNNVHPTSERLRRTVEAAVRDLGYEPRNPSPTTRLDYVGILTADLLNPYFNEMIAGIEDRTASHQVACSIFDLKRKQLGWDAAKRSFSAMPPRGCVVLGYALNDGELIELSDRLHVSVVAVHHSIRHPLIKTVNIDYGKASYDAMSHLLRLNHRSIVFLGGFSASHMNQGKLLGVAKAAKEAGVSWSEANVIYGEPSVEWGYRVTKRLFALPKEKRPTAVLCACDLIAIGVLHAVRSSGYAVPDDLSVIGFDDIVMACHTNPPLTTISVPKYEMGCTSAELILRGQAAPSHLNDYLMLESPLLVRDTTAICVPGLSTEWTAAVGSV